MDDGFLFILVSVGIAFVASLLFGVFNHHENEYDIPMCDNAMHGSHWSVWTHDANEDGNQITQQYLERGWHNITVEIHNDGVNDRVLADC